MKNGERGFWKILGKTGQRLIEAQRVKLPTPSQATDALIGDEEQNGKQKRTKRKKQGTGSQPSYPGPFSCLL